MVDSGSFRTTSFLQDVGNYDGVNAGVLLSNSHKDAQFKDAFAKLARKGIDPSRDLSQLDVCFGGFSPTAMDGNIDELKGRSEEVEARIKSLNEAKQKAAEVEKARASESRELTEGQTTWRYVILDEAEVRIEACTTEETEVGVPATIEGMPVVALAVEAFASQQAIQKLTMPDTIVSIGFCAFRDCYGLRSVELSGNLSKFDSGWFRGCQKIETLKLPGKLENITSSIFDLASLKQLIIGEAASSLMPGAFQKSQLELVEVSPDNPYMATDGQALYSKSGLVLLALAVPLAKYEVRPGCKALARKAFGNMDYLAEVTLPDTIEIVSDFAFSRTSIRQFFAPASLKAIGERAFFACKELRTVILNDGIQFIGKNAYADTPISQLRVPASIEELDHPIAEGTSLTYSGSQASFSIGPNEGEAVPSEGQKLELDEFGALYRNEEDGLHLFRMLEPAVETYEVREGTVKIDEGAFAKHPSITEVFLPDSVLSIGKGAFKDARKLMSIKLSNNIQEIGEEAFLDTSLTELFIPASLTRIGEIALISEGSHHGTIEPSLRKLEVDPANPKFRMESGLLLERMDDGTDRVILCTGSHEDVVVPTTVKVIATYAFNGVRRIKSLSISEKVIAVNMRGLAFDCMLEKIHVDLMEPLGDRTYFDFQFPDTVRAAQQMRHAFSSLNAVSAEDIFNHYDNSIVSRSGFDARTNEKNLTAYEQGARIVERLKDPVFMLHTNRSLMESALSSHLLDICVDVAKHDDKSVIEGLFDLGFITEDNIDEIIEAVGPVQDASVTNYLLDQKRRRFGSTVIDFGL